MEVQIGENRMNVIVTKKRMKNMVLRVDGNTLKVSCPYHVNEDTIRKFIAAKENWILKTCAKQKRSEEINREGIDGPTIHWLGEKKYVRYVEAKRDYVTMEGDILTFHLKEETDERIRKAFRKFASEKIMEIVNEQRGEWDELICRQNGLPLPEINVRYMTSRWGVCYVRKNRISLSTRLIHYPVEGLTYVLLHEYAHFLVPNHSKRFYSVIETYMPGYKYYDKVLKK